MKITKLFIFCFFTNCSLFFNFLFGANQFEANQFINQYVQNNKRDKFNLRDAINPKWKIFACKIPFIKNLYYICKKNKKNYYENLEIGFTPKGKYLQAIYDNEKNIIYTIEKDLNDPIDTGIIYAIKFYASDNNTKKHNIVEFKEKDSPGYNIYNVLQEKIVVKRLLKNGKIENICIFLPAKKEEFALNF
jgi:hypothetical protein